MATNDMKLAILNSFTIVLTTLGNIEMILKIILLFFSIVYTGVKIVELYKNKIKNKNGPNNNSENKDPTSED
jgi:hypothetical protein